MNRTRGNTVIIELDGKHGNAVLEAFLEEELSVKSKIEPVTFMEGGICLNHKGRNIVRPALHEYETWLKGPYVGRISLKSSASTHGADACTHLTGISPHPFGK